VATPALLQGRSALGRDDVVAAGGPR
jgi:hypothetical protein